ncbi:hypothetical protein GL218_00175 [Daldinia childiae]|uniref:uncharacterized protein n=1 Tax=Daldinia childiae TaxID=326645 RepID=UPI00144854D7|nr:uncharacterized protein GL218_00175 [Daldinia childiae]KAF3070506.1 hypothetical protein GL218_00175 [Daldinia childiae]
MNQFLLQGGPKRRRVESKLYIFNLFGVLTIFAVICILTFVYRTAQMNKGRCIIGIEKQALIPLIVLEIVANVYIMALFLNPLWNVYSLKGASNAPANPPGLRPAAIRTFVGALFTTTSSIVNLIVLMVLNGEPGWIFFACCNADILFSTLIIQWVASGDDDNTIASSSPSNPPGSQATYRPSPRAPSLPSRRSQKLAISLPLKTTSTSQYEHIFGEIEPGTETDVVSTSSVSKHKAGSLRFDEDNDGFHTPIIYDGPEGDISDGARNERATSSIWTSPPPPSSARADAGADDRASGKSHTSTQPPTHESLSVSAAVAADLERIRRYRGRRTNWSSTTATTSTPPPPPTSTSITSRSHSPAPVPRTSRSRTAARGRGSVREYYISRLDFEEEGGGAGARWDELIQAEEEGRGENGEMVGWI